MTKEESQLFLIRVTLGLNPIHDPVECVRILYEQGREAFEKVRGEPCQHAHEWKPSERRFEPHSGGMSFPAGV